MKRLPRRHVLGIVAAVVVVGVLLLYFSLSRIVLHYVNSTLEEGLHGYSGSIGDLDLDLVQGGYELRNVRIDRDDGDGPSPFFAADSLHFTLNWNSLLDGRLTGEVEMRSPTLILVHGDNAQETQAGEEGEWLQVVKDLTPFLLDRGEVRDGSVRFRTTFGDEEREIDLTQVNIIAENLSNYGAASARLVGSIAATARLAGAAPVQLRLSLDPQSEEAYFDCDLLLRDLDVTQLTPLTRSYANFDFEGGRAELAAEIAVKGGQIRGYVKPIITDFAIAQVEGDIAQDRDGPFIFTWENLVGLFSFLIEDKQYDRLATIIPITGPADDPEIDIWEAVGNAFENAYGASIANGLENNTDLRGGFEPDPDAYLEKLEAQSVDQEDEARAGMAAQEEAPGPSRTPPGLHGERQ